MLTRKQHELLLYINERLSETGVSPSFEEMKGANHFFWAKYPDLTETVGSWLEEVLPAPNDDRVDHQPQLVDEVRPEQRPDERAASRDRDVLPGALLELRDRFGDVALDQSGVLPADRIQ